MSLLVPHPQEATFPWMPLKRTDAPVHQHRRAWTCGFHNCAHCWGSICHVRVISQHLQHTYTAVRRVTHRLHAHLRQLGPTLQARPPPADTVSGVTQALSTQLTRCPVPQGKDTRVVHTDTSRTVCVCVCVYLCVERRQHVLVANVSQSCS